MIVDPISAWLTLVRNTLRRAFRGEGRRPVKLKMKMLRWALKLGFMKDHRRKIGIGLFLSAAVIEVLTGSDLLTVCSESTGGMCGWLNAAQPWLVAAGSYVASVGELFKNDAKGKPKS